MSDAAITISQITFHLALTGALVCVWALAKEIREIMK